MKQSKYLLAEFERMRQERNGEAGLIQCAGCPDRNLVPEEQELCMRHRGTSPHAWQAYTPGFDEGYDVAGNL